MARTVVYWAVIRGCWGASDGGLNKMKTEYDIGSYQHGAYQRSTDFILLECSRDNQITNPAPVVNGRAPKNLTSFMSRILDPKHSTRIPQANKGGHTIAGIRTNKNEQNSNGKSLTQTAMETRLHARETPGGF